MTGSTTTHSTLPIPERIGPYRILQVLGEGGMGVVYEAEETGAVRRRVALKVVRAGRDTKEVVARFDAERQALAVMSHPAIAKVLHAGTTESGQPYFAMELVKGLPITMYCDTHRLSVQKRLELFIGVCQAVQHAHQKGVIHRDLKPSNVLVGEQDGLPQPKIIDFGIAKAVGSQLTDRTLVTQWGQMMGTAAYMSPEQADSGTVDVDTRSDIYSLGVMLFELLVGRLPIDPTQQGMHAFMARLAAGDTSPPTPSAKLMMLGDEGTLVAETRRTVPAALRRQLKGDLDWIVMKAMEPDRSHRYETANGLASDLRRHLNHEPVVARPRSTRYRVRKFVRRHRTGVITAGAVSVAVLASAILAVVGFVRATQAEHRAAQEAAAAQAVTDFLVDLFRISDPRDAATLHGDSLTARQILDRGADRVKTELAEQPVLQARIMYTLGTVQHALGLFEPARSLLDEARRNRERAFGPRDLSVAETLNALADIARDKGDFDDADRLYLEALAIRESLLGTEHIDVATTLGGLAALRVRQGRPADAEPLYSRVLALDESVRDPDDPRTARDLRGLGAVYYSTGRYDEAEPLWRRTLAMQERVLGPNHYDVGSTLLNLGALYWRLGRYEDALPLYNRARSIYENVLGPNHMRFGEVLNNLGETYWKLRRNAEAEPLLRQALAVKEKVLTPGAPSIAVTLNALAGVLRDTRRGPEAEELYRRALGIRTAAPGAGNEALIETLRDYAVLLRRSGREREAAELEGRAARLSESK
jgi:non-specific serine/threonine protein kinase/serine/threonine-protein kinase